MLSPKKARKVSLLVFKLFRLLKFGCFIYGSNYRELSSLYLYICNIAFFLLHLC